MDHADAGGARATPMPANTGAGPVLPPASSNSPVWPVSHTSRPAFHTSRPAFHASRPAFHAPRSARPCDDEDAQPVVGRAYVRRLPRLVGRRESVHVDVGRAAVAQAGLFEESGASGPAPVVLVAHGRGGQQSADVLGDDEPRAADADALRVVEPQAGARASFQSGAASGGGYALAAEAARHDVHVAQGVPVYPGDVLQVGDAGVSVGEYGAWAGVYVGHGGDPRAAERPLDGQVKPAVAGEQAYHSRFVFHASGYASPAFQRDTSDGAWTRKRIGRWAVWPSGSG